MPADETIKKIGPINTKYRHVSLNHLNVSIKSKININAIDQRNSKWTDKVIDELWKRKNVIATSHRHGERIFQYTHMLKPVRRETESEKD